MKVGDATKLVRCIDDIFSVIKKKDLNETLNRLNSIYGTVRFTHEVEDV